jgi:23S rRNA (adenine-N6)-dimethyltransferase
VVQVDAGDLRLPRRAFRVVANPPFALTTTVLRRLVAPGSRLVTADLVVPRHIAVRWSRLRAPGSVRWSQTFDARVTRLLPRVAFRPPPPGDTAVLRIERRGPEGAP